jgi:hypothetical protein
MRTLAVLAAALAVAAGAAAQPASPAARACGTVTARLGGNDFTYRVKLVSGRVECATARRVVRRFIAGGVVTRGWTCARGHSRDRWGAGCARLSPSALVRAYLVAG